MSVAQGPWVIILAGGRGVRLRALTTSLHHISVPKQFCRLGGQESLLASTLARARTVTDDDRILVVVLRSHRRWWQPELVTIRSENLLVESGNRGTALALLRALLLVRQRDRHASVVVLPSDHVVDDEAILRNAILDAVRHATLNARRVVLLGAAATAADPTLGWIVSAAGSCAMAAAVEAFVEKPDPARAIECVRRGALRNTLIMAADAQELLDLFAFAQPGRLAIAGMTGSAIGPGAFMPGALPRKCVPMDLGHDILERAARRLHVLPLAECGWTDIGTPERLRAWWLAHPTALAHALRHGILPRSCGASPGTPAGVKRFVDDEGTVALDEE